MLVEIFKVEVCRCNKIVVNIYVRSDKFFEPIPDPCHNLFVNAGVRIERKQRLGKHCNVF